MINQEEISRLAKQLNLTRLDEEPIPYLLSEKDENLIFENEKLRVQRGLVWKLRGLAYSDAQIEKKIAEIDWEKEIDKKGLFETANSNKEYEIWQKSQREKEKLKEVEHQENLKKTWTAQNVFKLMKWTSENVYGKPLIVSENNKKLITAICYFVSEDERFETELGYSFKKGLMIRGISGLGKTHLAKCVEKNELNPILILSMIEISEKIKDEGEYQINLGKNKIIYLDDVGTEEATITHYGTKINFFKNFIEMVYLKNKTFGKLMISTNNSFSEIEEKYGFRVRSRMKDMFNILDAIGSDLRG